MSGRKTKPSGLVAEDGFLVRERCASGWYRDRRRSGGWPGRAAVCLVGLLGGAAAGAALFVWFVGHGFAPGATEADGSVPDAGWFERADTAFLAFAAAGAIAGLAAAVYILFEERFRRDYSDI